MPLDHVTALRLVGALVAAVLALTGCSTATTSPAGSTPTATAPAPAPVDTRPLGVTIPAIGAASNLIPTGKTADGRLATPPVEQPEQASWWSGSGRPGAAGRPVVLLGHVDGAGRPGVFARLDELDVGDEVFIDRFDGARLRYVVGRVEQHSKAVDDFPTLAVYGDTAAPELRLITCGGTFDRSRGHYVDNVIAFARLAPGG